MFIENNLAKAIKKLDICIFMNEDNTQPIAVFWFRRDLRLYDNTALFKALTSGLKVLPVFIFDTTILNNLTPSDKRVSFIYQAIEHLNQLLFPFNTSVQLHHGNPVEIFKQLLTQYSIISVFANHDYEPYAMERDLKIKRMLEEKGVDFQTFKDQVIFEKDEVTKLSGEPYTIFTPYCHRWLDKLKQETSYLQPRNSEDYLFNFLQTEEKPNLLLNDIGFIETKSVFNPLK